MLADKKVGFIGGGNMASAMIGGLLAAGLKRENVVVSDPWEPSRQKLENDFGIKATTNNVLVIDSDVVILAVKPQVMKDVAHGIASALHGRSVLFISIAAGVTIPDLSRWLMHDAPANSATPSIVRCMPNTPALLQQGATGLYAGSSLA
jgi:pyrroline-5-carboxylate reductase